MVERSKIKAETECEKALLAHDFRLGFAPAGEKIGQRPEKQTEYNHVRGAFLRDLILGEFDDVEIPPDGLKLSSLWIVGGLDLNFCEVKFPLAMVACHFEDDIELRQARMRELVLNETRLNGLIADHARIEGHVFLKGAEAQGEVRLLGAQIGGQLDCQNAKLHGQPKSLAADRAHIEGHVFLDSAEAQGDVWFLGAQIGGQLDCQNAQFENGLILQNAEIKDACFFEFNTIGQLNLSVGQLRDIRDNKNCWPQEKKLILDGAIYTGFVGNAPNDATTRLKWLELNHRFAPQPYRQLAKVFRNEGKTRDANAVLYEMENKLAKAYRANKKKLEDHENSWAWLRERLGIVYDQLFKLTTGYGYRLHRAIGCILGLSSITWLLAFTAYHWGEMVPNSDVILTSPHYLIIDDPLQWVEATVEGRDWQSFNSVSYALDVVVPIINLNQEEAWAPSPSRGKIGGLLWFLSWIMKLAGWGVVTFALASATGLLQTRHNE